MHEYAITQNIIEIVSKASGNAKVKKINFVIGEASGILSEAIELYFPLIAKNASCENAELNFERVKPTLKCSNCGKLFEREAFSFDCVHCGKGTGSFTETGREFFIKSVELENGDY